MAEPETLDKHIADANEASATARNIWITFLLFGTYLAITIGAITHRDLVLKSAVKLPILDVGLPLVTFFWVAPLFFVVYHLYLLIHLAVLAGKLRRVDEAIETQIRPKTEGKAMRQRISPFLLAQMLSGPRDNRVLSFLIAAILWITVVAAPILLLLFFQIRFLPYHDAAMTWWHRGFLAADLAIVVPLWWAVVHSLVGGIVRHAAALLAMIILVVAPIGVFSGLVATVPGEAIEAWLLNQPWVGKSSVVERRERTIWWPTAFLFDGPVDYDTGAPRSEFSRNIVLIGADLVDDAKFNDAEVSINLRGRDFRYAVLARADLHKADLFRARFDGADLRSARLDRAQLRETNFNGANLEQANLERADLRQARLQGASATKARLTKTGFEFARLDGANLDHSTAELANFTAARLIGASLNYARLRSAKLEGSDFQGASLEQADLQGATVFLTDFRGASLWGADLRQTTAPLWRHVALADLREARFTFTDAIISGQGNEGDAWLAAAKSSGASEDRYDELLANFLAGLACATEQAPYVALGISRRAGVDVLTGPVDKPRRRLSDYAPLLAARLLDPACAGAKELPAGVAALLAGRVRHLEMSHFFFVDSYWDFIGFASGKIFFPQGKDLTRPSPVFP